MISSPLINPKCDEVNRLKDMSWCGYDRSLHLVHAASDRAIRHSRPYVLLKRRYVLLHQVGKGGMGTVYEAVDLLYSLRVAVKEMNNMGLHQQQLIEATDAFRREAHLMSRLHHPNLPTMYDYFTEAGRYYLVMDYIEGQTLEDLLSRMPTGKLPVKSVLAIGMQLCVVLDYLHTRPRPIVFRDLKPANIMVTPQGKLFLIDFGIARQFKPGQTQDTLICGTPGYVAPEQYAGKTQTTPLTDIYSLGATLYRLLTGEDPPLSPLLFMPLNSQSQALPTELVQLIKRMMDSDEYSRPTSTVVVGRALQHIVLQQVPTDLPP